MSGDVAFLFHFLKQGTARILNILCLFQEISKYISIIEEKEKNKTVT